MTRPPPPPGPYLVAGIGRAGIAAAGRLVAEGMGPLAAWDEHAPRDGAAAEALARLGVDLAPREPQAALRATGARCVVRSPGIAPAHPLLAAARGRGAAVIDELELGWRLGAAPLLGVTGTDGKSTVAHLVSRTLAAAGVPVELGGNFELGEPLSALPSPVGGWTVCEASSYQLEGCPEMLADAAVLANLGHDHLARHGTRARYGACKRRLLVRGRRAARIAVVNADDRFARRIGEEVAARGGEVRDFGREAGEYRVRSCEWGLAAAELALTAPGGSVELRTRLPGRHNALNVAAALAAAEGLGVGRGEAVEALSKAPGLPGRFERIESEAPFEAIVDFAHTPEAVAAVLGAVREVLARRRRGRLLALVSASGPPADDRTKRPLIGRAAAALADELVISTSNPRGEPPDSLTGDLTAGARDRGRARVHVEPDRRRALELLAGLARDDDVVVATGRGAQRRIEGRPGDAGAPFDDREVLGELLGVAVGPRQHGLELRP